MEGTVVSVCSDDEDCYDCGTAGDPGGGNWERLLCPAGTVGNQVKLANSGYLQTCEVKVRGEGNI